MFANVLSCVLFVSLAAVSIQGAPQFDCCNMNELCCRPICRPPCGFCQEPFIYRRLISVPAPIPGPIPEPIPAPVPEPVPEPKPSQKSCDDPCAYCCACKIGSACKPTACYVPNICIKPKITVQPRFACYKPICYGDCCICGDVRPCPPDCNCGCCKRN